MDYHIKHTSEFLYFGLCKKIGFPTQVSIRRDVMDMEEKIRLLTDKKYRMMVSGSRREGFNLPSSDLDIMLWNDNIKVVCDIRQSEYYRSPNVTFVLMENSEEHPGFAFLQYLIKSYNNFVASGIYISSTGFKYSVLQRLGDPSIFIHGPCATHLDGDLEGDEAYCLACAYWPSPATPWIERCQRSGWPSSAVIQDIIHSGFHLVPVGCKNSPQEDNEWRISFSQTEQKLVHSMNHVQFLCYGLLKLFLKEAINVNIENPSLCSYFMKTVVFWEIQEKQNHSWTPSNILIHFWQCFKRVILWVQRAECPNFFIPSYNMFLGRVVGSVQHLMLTKLYDLYSMGVSCLLRCDSVSLYMTTSICNQMLSVSTNEMYFLQEADVDLELYLAIFSYVNPNCQRKLSTIIRCLKAIETLAQLPHNRYQRIVLECYFSGVLQEFAVYLHSTRHTLNNNKKLYDIDRWSCRVLKLAAKFGNISDLLHVSMYYYKMNMQRQASYYTELAKHKLSRPYLWFHVHMNRELYTNAMGGMPLSKKMREAVARDIRLDNDVVYIEDLKLEQIISKGNHHRDLLIPPFVMVTMLTVLCHRGDTNKQLEALHDLHSLLTNDHDQVYTDCNTRDISWQILGICYQICGDFHNALLAYQQSISQPAYHKIQEASDIRICSLMEALGQ